MSDTLESLRLVVGARPGWQHQLLNASRFEGFGTEVVGSRNIGDVFRSAPFVLAAKPHFVAQDSTLAVLDADQFSNPVCFFADLYDHRMGRLWRLGPTLPVSISTDPAISVPFDPRLSQVASRVAFNAADHIDLDAQAAEHVSSVVDRLCTAAAENHSISAARRTAFVVRAVSRESTCAVLVQLHECTTDRVRRSYFRLAAVFFRFAGNQVVHSIECFDDYAGGDWTPRVGRPVPSIAYTPDS